MDARIEKLARKLCVKAGDQPERRIKEYGRTSWAYPAWLDWVDEAKSRMPERALKAQEQRR